MISQGRCLCGDITWEMAAEPYAVYNCHCKMCRKIHGTAFGTYSFIKPDQFRWTSGTESIVHYRSSELLKRSSCGTCGSVVPYASDDGSHWVTPAGCHDTGKKPDCNVFAADNAPWHAITNGLPDHDAYPEDSGLSSVPGTPVADPTTGVVRGSCQCGAVAFHVTEAMKIVHNCHCSRCRHARAAAHATNGFTSSAGVTFIKGEDNLDSYKLPEARYFTQVFCRTCSAIMPRIDESRDIAVIPLGALDDDPGIRPADHIFVAFKAGWHDITDGLPQFETVPPRS